MKKFTQLFDGVEPDTFTVTEEEIQDAENLVSDELKAAIKTAYTNIHTFHQKQMAAVEVIETMPGVQCWRKSIAIEKVGLYIPGGTAPLFSTVLMLAVPAQIAGCAETILCSPPDKQGKIHPAILYTANLCGVKKMEAVEAEVERCILSQMGWGSLSPNVREFLGNSQDNWRRRVLWCCCREPPLHSRCCSILWC